jgi:hypothetical protein
MWVYLSGPHYSMHDTCKDAIKFDDPIKLRIIDYLTENFGEIIASYTDKIQTYLLGLFLGNNVQFLTPNKEHPFLPTNIYDYAKVSRYFEQGLGHGTGEVFPFLNQILQEEINVYKWTSNLLRHLPTT